MKNVNQNLLLRPGCLAESDISSARCVTTGDSNNKQDPHRRVKKRHDMWKIANEVSLGVGVEKV